MNWNINRILFCIFILIFLSCEDKKEKEIDLIPPNVLITSPASGSTVNEVVLITCISEDNEGIEKVELWVDGDSTGINDYSVPFEMEWNTVLFEDNSVHNIKVRSYDVNENMADSDPINLEVDNSGSHPTNIELFPINYDNGTFSIIWSQNNDTDFSIYKLYESNSHDMSEKILVAEINVKTDTSIFLSDILPNQQLYFQLDVVDTLGLKTKSNIVLGHSYSWKVFEGEYNTSNDMGRIVIQTLDGGYMVVSSTWGQLYGGLDLWLIKTDSKGDEEWNRVFGGFGHEFAYGAQQTTDGGFVIIGSSLIKTDSQGNEEWVNENIGGRSVQQTEDGGYIITGTVNTPGRDDNDIWLIKTDSNGNEEWNRMFGIENYNESGWSVQQTNDDGYIIAGSNKSLLKTIVIKTDFQGNEEWNKTIDGSGSFWGMKCQQTSDSGFIIFDTSENFNVRLIKLNSQGIEEWIKIIEINSKGFVRSGQQTIDGGFIIIGTKEKSSTWWNTDLFLLKTNSQGEENWRQLYGGRLDERGSSIQQTTDGGYIMTGYTETFSNDRGGAWLIKTDSEGNINPIW